MAIDADSESPRSRTFQGRPIIRLNWSGEKVWAVQGAVAYRTVSKERISLAEASKALLVDVLEVTQADPLGISIVFTDAELPAENIATARERMKPDVIWIEPVLVDHGTDVPDDTYFSQQWNFADIKAVRGWNLWNGDASTVVLAVLDSGIPIESGGLSHQDLNDASRFYLGGDLVNNDSDPADDHGHGTHVTGIAAAATNNGTGVAGLWPGPVVVLKVFDAFNEGSSVTFKDGVLASVKFAQERRVHLIINYSGGGPSSETKKAATEHANKNGALVVAAAGNEFGGGIVFPAAYSTLFPNVIATGALNRQHERPGFGSQGPEMTVVAPGVDILSTLPNYFVTLNDEGKQIKYDRLNGTSQATPLTAGLAALVWSQWPGLTATEVRDKIIQSATPLAGSFNDFGHGMINAEAALS
jgi:subtilisin family serine protease